MLRAQDRLDQVLQNRLAPALYIYAGDHSGRDIQGRITSFREAGIAGAQHNLEIGRTLGRL